jgi:DNA-binding protein YbaB
MKKATHSGTCQVCGALQKLPNGKLSKHGYTTRWGFFEGVCWGADHEPFELSKDLIEEAIERATQGAKNNRAEAKKRERMTDPNDVWHDVYLNCERVTKHGRVSMVGRKFKSGTHGDEVAFIYQDRHFVRREDFTVLHDWRMRTVEDAVKQMNAERAGYLRHVAEQQDEYVKWQQQRIKDWKPHPEQLKPVK